jgi:hypothetical protein
MKKLLTLASGAKRQPYTNTTFDHLQEAYQEAINALAECLIPDNTQYVILYGCEATLDGTDWSCTAGAIYYSGEIYLFNAVEPGEPIAMTGTDVPVLTLMTGYAAGDPITFTDGTTGNVHEIKTFTATADTSGSGDVDYNDLVRLRNMHEFIDVIPSTFTNRYDSGGGTYVWETPDTRNMDAGAYFKINKKGKVCTVDFNVIADFNSGSPNNLAQDMCGMGFNLPDWALPAESGEIVRTYSVESSAGSTYKQPEGQMLMRIYTGDGDANAPHVQFLCQVLVLNGGTAGITTYTATGFFNFNYTATVAGTRMTSGTHSFQLRCRGSFSYEAANYDLPITF